MPGRPVCVFLLWRYEETAPGVRLVNQVADSYGYVIGLKPGPRRGRRADLRAMACSPTRPPTRWR